MWHTLARTCADCLIGSTKKSRSNGAWHQVYRHLDHGEARKQCAPEGRVKQETFKKFPAEIQEFATLFVTMQSKRHAADYDPLAPRLKLSAVKTDLEMVKSVISKFEAVDPLHKRAFSAWVLLKVRA